VASNLPSQSTSFVGRSAELAAITRRLADPQCRLLTLLGPGGMGKTRLALAVAAAHTAAFPDSVAFVPLAAIGMPNQIISAIGAALRLSFVGQSDPTSHLLNKLRARHTLLVLDSFEHLLGCCGSWGSSPANRAISHRPGRCSRRIWPSTRSLAIGRVWDSR